MKTKQVAEVLRSGGIVASPTDTIYGLLVSAWNQSAVEKLYRLRQRDAGKPFIILISAASDLVKFGIVLTEKQKPVLASIWPGPVSVILDCPKADFTYLHRGRKTLAFRVPQNQTLIELLKEAGPLVAPSANPAGQTPACNEAGARAYFGDQIDLYLEGESFGQNPSILIELSPDGDVGVRRGILKR